MPLTQKDLRAIELAKKYERHHLPESLHDYHFFLDTLMYLHEALSEHRIPIIPWQKLSEPLLHKFYFHGLTMHRILSGLSLHSVYYKEEMNGKSIIDISSAKTVLRSQFEAFLMYHYIYVNPDNDDLKELRYHAWIYSSLLQRQGLAAQTDFAKKQKEKAALELEKMRTHIRSLKSFQLLTPKQQISLIKTGSGKLFSYWANIMKETGFTETSTFYRMYELLSIYSHSEGLSIIQLENQPGRTQSLESQANADLHHAKLLNCLMIASVCKLYPSVQQRFDALPEVVRWDVDLYCLMAIPEKFFQG